jgi:hypothetical protein
MLTELNFGDERMYGSAAEMLCASSSVSEFRSFWRGDVQFPFGPVFGSKAEKKRGLRNLWVFAGIDAKKQC